MFSLNLTFYCNENLRVLVCPDFTTAKILRAFSQKPGAGDVTDVAAVISIMEDLQIP